MISGKISLDDNLNLCMHLLNEIVPPQDRRELPMEVDDVEEVYEVAFHLPSLGELFPLMSFIVNDL